MLLLLVWWCQPQAFFWCNLWFQAWIRSSSRSTTCFELALDRRSMSGLRVISSRNLSCFLRSTLMSLARIPVPSYVRPGAFSCFNNYDEVGPFCPDVSTRLLPLLLQTCRQFKLYLIVPPSELTISKASLTRWQNEDRQFEACWLLTEHAALVLRPSPLTEVSWCGQDILSRA